MFLRPRFFRLWMLLAGGVLVAMCIWVLRQSHTSIDDKKDFISLDIKNHQVLPNDVANLIKNLSKSHAVYRQHHQHHNIQHPNTQIHLPNANNNPTHQDAKKLGKNYPHVQQHDDKSKNTTAQDQYIKPKSVMNVRQDQELQLQPRRPNVQRNTLRKPENGHRNVTIASGNSSIHFQPLRYSTSELLARLESLQLDEAEMDARIDEQLRICSKLETQNDNTTHFYQDLISSSLAAWHVFVPHQEDMVSSHCWYSDAFNSRVPSSLERRLSIWQSLYHIEEQYPKKEISAIFNTVFSKNTRNVFYNVPPSTNKYNRDSFMCVPKVYLGGFPKCGTTALYSYLILHPQISQPHSKEGHFWREFVITGDKDYQQLEMLLYLYHFKDAASKIKRNVDGRMTIDASASTVFASAKRWLDVEKDMCIVPQLLSKALPSVKLIFLMRDPVKRLWSDYWYFCSHHFNSKGVPNEILERSSELFHNHSIAVIEDFVDCVSQGRSEFECTMLAHSDTPEFTACRSARVGMSLYYFHVIRWLSVFPREQILLLTSEELKENTYSVVSKVWRFLGLTPLPESRVTRSVDSNSNEWIKAEEYRGKISIWPETRRILEAFYHPYNARLARLLKDDQFLWNS